MALGVSVGVGVNNARLRTGLADAKKRVEGFAATTKKKLGDSISKGFSIGALAGGGLAVVLDQMIDKYDGIAKAASKAGMDPEAFQRQSHAFKKAGVSIEDYTNTVAKLVKKIDDAERGSETMVQAFDTLGLSVSALKALSPDEQMLALADAFATAKDQGQAMAALMVILEEEGTKFRGVFEGGSAAIKEAGDKLKNVATAEDLERIEKYNALLDDLTANFQNLVIKVTEIPGLFNKAGQGFEHMLNVITKGKAAADRILFTEISQENLTEHGREGTLMASLPESERKRLLAQRHGPAPERPSLDALAMAENPFARLSAMTALTGTGSATGAPSGMNSDAVHGTLRKIAFDIGRMADTGVVVKTGMGEY